jgi:hypothetical protein
MKKSAKKRVGRPPGRKAPHRPVVSARVPHELYEQIKREAASNGRTAGEELVYRAGQIYEWQQRFGDSLNMVAEAQRVAEAELEFTLDRNGWRWVHGIGGTGWFPPGVEPKRWLADNMNPPILEELLERAVTRALAKARSEGS